MRSPMRAIMPPALLLAAMLTVVGCRDTRTRTTASGGKGDTPAARLHWAARNGDLKSAQSLIAGGCDVDARDKDGGTPLTTAAAFDQAQVVALLISRGADVNANSLTGSDVLQAAHSADVARLLIDAGAQVRAGHLHEAAWYERKDVVELLLARGVQIDPSAARDNERLLCFAVRNGFRDLTEKLLDAGTDANTKDIKHGGSALVNAVECADKEMAKLLIAHGADVNTGGDHGQSPLYYAASYNKDVIELLLARGANTNAGPILHNAVARGDREIVRLFLAHGADTSVRDADGKTPLDLATDIGDTAMAELLRKHGAVSGAGGSPESASRQ